MSDTTTYSREFLRGYRDQHRRQMVDNHVKCWASDILTSAQQGKMEWSFNIGKWRQEQERSGFRTHPPTYVPTDADIAEGLLRKFPDCDVEISESWVDTRPGNRELQTRITVSWK